MMFAHKVAVNTPFPDGFAFVRIHAVGPQNISPFALDSALLLTSVMLSKVCSAALNGIEAYPVEVEVNAGWGDTVIVKIETK